MAYNPNTDYMAIIQNPSSTAAQKAAAEIARGEKIAAMNAAGTNTNNYTATYNYATNPTKPTGNNTPVGYTGSTKTTGAVSSAAQNIINQMNANSLKWYTDPVNKDKYAAENQRLAQQLSTIKDVGADGSVTTYSANHDAGSGTWSVTPNATQNVPVTTPVVAGAAPRPELIGLELGDKYGINYDMEKIKQLLNEATRAEFGLRNQQQQQLENKFYGTMLDTQSTALDTLRRGQASAVATGASRGMAAANELSAILNLQQASTDLATDLSVERGNLNKEEAAAYTKNASTALDSSNALKQAIASLAGTKYGYDTQGYAADLSYLAALQDVIAQKYASDKTLEGVKYNADANVAAAGKTYGTSGKSFTGGNTGGSDKTTTDPSALADLDIKIAANKGYTPDGWKYTINSNGDGTYTLTGVTDANGAASNLTVDANEMEKIKNNGYDPASVMDTNYGTETIKTKYDVGNVTNTKNWTEQQALDYMHMTGQLAPGWYVDPTVGPKYALEATYVGESKTKDYTITGAQGQKIAVGQGNYTSTWTYNAKTGMWTNNSGGSKNMNDFKTYLKKQNQAYVKALN